MRYTKLILVMACLSGLLYSCASCETGGATPQHQVGQGAQQPGQQKHIKTSVNKDQEAMEQYPRNLDKLKEGIG